MIKPKRQKQTLSTGAIDTVVEAVAAVIIGHQASLLVIDIQILVIVLQDQTLIPADVTVIGIVHQVAAVGTGSSMILN